MPHYKDQEQIDTISSQSHTVVTPLLILVLACVPQTSLQQCCEKDLTCHGLHCRLLSAALVAYCHCIQAGAPEPAKFLGHGYCDSLSRSVTLGNYVSTAAEVYDQAAVLLVAIKIPPEEIRGMGITVRIAQGLPISALGVH